MSRTGYHSYSAGGMPMGHLPRRSPMGSDPNYRDGAYRGGRGYEDAEAAPYGRYRMEHGRELGGYGGADGRNTGAGHLRPPPPTRPSGPMGGPRPGSPIELRGRTPGRPPLNEPRGYPGGAARRGPYDGDFPRMQGSRPDRGRIRFAEGDRPPGRGGAGAGAPSRALRYDGAFDRTTGFRSQGFSEGFLGSGHRR